MATRPPIGLPKLPRRGKIVLSIAVGLIGLLLIIGARLLSAYVDWLWFGEVGFRKVFTTVLFTRIVLFLVVALVVGAIIWLALLGAYRSGRCSCPSPGPTIRSRATAPP